MHRDPSLAESVGRGAMGGAAASLVVLSVRSIIVRRLAPQRLAPTARLEDALSRSLGIKRRPPFTIEAPAFLARRLLAGLLWGAAYGAARSAGRVPAATSGPLFGCALGALDAWVVPPALRALPTSDEHRPLPELMQFGLHVLFGTLVGQVFAADRALAPPAMIQSGIPPLDGMAHRFAQRPERQDTSSRVSNVVASRASVSVESPRTSLGPDDLDGRLVFDREDRALGQVKRFTQSYVEVAAPTLDIGPTLYLPFDAFCYCSPAGCYLRYTLEQISASGWHRDPGVVAATEPGPAESGGGEGADPVPIVGVVGRTVGSAELAPGVLIPYFAAEEDARRYREQRAS